VSGLAALLAAVGGHEPQLGEGVFRAAGSVVLGQVTLGARVSVWYGTVVRADAAAIAVGPETNLQDGTVVHADPGFPATIGARVSVGHRAVLHGCTIGDDVLVGMGATVLNGAVVGAGSLIAAGAVVLQGAQVPPGSLVAGVPGRVVRPLRDDELAMIAANAQGYLLLAEQHRQIGAA